MGLGHPAEKSLTLRGLSRPREYSIELGTAPMWSRHFGISVSVYVGFETAAKLAVALRGQPRVCGSDVMVASLGPRSVTP